MKSSRLVTFITIGLIACFAATGCKKKPQRATPLPGQAAAPVGSENSGAKPLDDGKGLGEGGAVKAPVEGANLAKTPDGTEVSKRSLEGRPQDRSKWKNQTVYFEFDRSVVRSGEAGKVDTVASEFKACDPNTDLLIEGHCDERGTSEYNRALGERRAQALRDYLINAGVDANRVHTLSFGKDNPAVMGHDEAAYSKNRRGEFILVLPK